MAYSPNNKQFTPEEIARITSLPLRSGNVGGTKREGYFDPETETFYLVDEDGNLVGKVGKKRTPAAAPPTPPAKEHENSEKNEDREDDDDEDAPRSLPKGAKIGIIVGGSVFGVVLLVLLITSLLMPALRRGPAPTPMETPVAVTTVTPEPTIEPIPEDGNNSANIEGAIEVIQAKQNVHKGEQITEDIVEMIAISPEEFNSLILTGITPAKWEDLDTLMDMYANRFIPQGQYVAVTYISTSSPVPSNPWADPDGRYATISIAASSLAEGDVAYFGAKGTLTLVRETTVVDANEENTTEDSGEELDVTDPNADTDVEGTEDEHIVIEGITYETDVMQSLVVDHYEIEDVVVCDLLNGDGESIYDYVSLYFDMPELNRRSEFLARCEDAEYLYKVTPVELVVRMTFEQSELVGSFDNLLASYDIDSNAADGDAQTIIVNATRLTSEMVRDLTAEFDTVDAVIPADLEELPTAANG